MSSKRRDPPTPDDLPEELRGVWTPLGWTRKGGQSRPIRVRRESDKIVGVFKQPLSIEDKTGLDRFIRELGILQTLSHPGVADLEVFGEEDDVPYFITKEGKTLWSYWENKIKSKGNAIALFHESKDIVIRIIEALAFCHQNGIHHRDIKPDNVIFMDNDYSKPKLIDFGLAFIEGETRLTVTGKGPGNTLFRPPCAYYEDQVKVETWWDTRSTVFLWIWLLTPWRFHDYRIWHYRYHKFVPGLGWRTDQLRALWGLIDNELGPKSAEDLMDSIEARFNEPGEYETDEDAIRKALDAKRRGDAEADLLLARKQESIDSGIEDWVPNIVRLLTTLTKYYQSLPSDFPVRMYSELWNAEAEAPDERNSRGFLIRASSEEEEVLIVSYALGIPGALKGQVSLVVGFGREAPGQSIPVYYGKLRKYAPGIDETLKFFRSGSGNWTNLQPPRPPLTWKDNEFDDKVIYDFVQGAFTDEAMWASPYYLHE